MANDDATLLDLCDVGDVRPDAPCRVEASGMAYAVFQLGDAYYVTQDTCTHGPGSLSEGYIEGSEVECPFHQGRFCIVTGKPTSAPCTIPLQVWNVVVRAGRICIDASQAGRAEA